MGWTGLTLFGPRIALMTALVGILCIVGSLCAAAQGIHPAQRATAAAKAEEAEPDPVKQSLEALLAPLVREAVRAELQTAKKVKPATGAMDEANDADPFAKLIENIRANVGHIAENFSKVMIVAQSISEHASRAFVLLTGLKGWPVAWAGLLNLAVMLGVGFAAARLACRRLERFIKPATPEGFHLMPRLSASLIGLAGDALGLVVFVVVAFLVSLAWFEQNAPIRILLLGGLGAGTTTYAGWIIGRFLFAPDNEPRRIPYLSNVTAKQTARWLVFVVLITGVMTFAGGVFNLTSMPRGAYALLLMTGGLAVAAATALQLLWGRRRPSKIDEEPLGKGLCVFLLIGLLAMTVLWAMSLLSGDLTKPVAILVVFASVSAALYLRAIKVRRVRIVKDGTSDIPVDPEDAADLAADLTSDLGADMSAPAPHQEKVEVEYVRPMLARAVQFILIFIAGLALLHIFGIDMVAGLKSSIGLRITEAATKVAIILVVSAVAWTLVEQSIARIMEREDKQARAKAGGQPVDEDGLGGLVTSRFGTLLPLLRGFVLSVLAIITIMVVLSSMGIDIGPLLAGAGVAGIAIGFGAQALVRDIISGVFFLIDDAFRVGEYVEFGEIRGQVEKISIRSMRLRHHRGAIHTVPFGELRSITNYNRDWAIYKQEFRLPYDTDTEIVRKIIKKVGLALLEDPELGEKFIQPLKSQGVFRIEEGALILRTKFMCKPREQFVIRKAVFQEVKNALYAAGIELAQRRVQIEWNEYGQNSDQSTKDGPPAAAVAAAGAAGLIASTGKAKSAYPDEP